MVATKFKKFYAFGENKPPIYYRPDTSDQDIIQSILVNQQEYLFPTFDAKLIFDIGANIGAVSTLLANLYPNSYVWAFEPVKENFGILNMNAREYQDRILPMNFALGARNEKKMIAKSDNPKNFGGFSTHMTEGGDDSIVDFLSVDEFCQKAGTPDLIKIDVEGAEFEILSNIPNLDKVKWVTGELHSVCDAAVLGLFEKNFKLQFQRGFEDKCWHFHAINKAGLL